MWLLQLIADRIAIWRLRRNIAALRREKELLLEEMRIKDAAYARWEAERRDIQQHAAPDGHAPDSVDK